MSIKEFRSVFEREIDANLAKLQQKSASAPPSNLPVGDVPSPAGRLVPERVDELRQMANQMTENIMQRLAAHVAEWGVDDQSAGVGDTSVDSVAGQAPVSRRGLEARIAELERVLAEKRREAAQRQEALLARCKAEFASALNAREQELLEVQKEVSHDAAEAQRQSASLGRAADVQQEFAEHIDVIRSRIAIATKAAGDLHEKRHVLNKVVAQTAKGLSKAEEAMAGAWRGEDLDAEDGEERELLESISQGEQVCKRLRRHQSGAA